MARVGLTKLDRCTWFPLWRLAQGIAYLAVAAAVFGVLLAEALNEARHS